MDLQSQKPSITVGGNVLGPKRIMLLGASMVREFTTCHHLETTYDDDLTESERRRARELVKDKLFDMFRKSKPQYPSLIPIEDAEHPDDLAYGIDIRFCEGTQHDKEVLENRRKPNLGRDIRLEVEGRSIHIHEMGGGKPERKEWMTYFQHVDTFMFVVSLISYSQASRRDPNANQMQEYLTIFESVSKSSDLRTVPIILLFNNYDLLRQRMKDYPVVNYYPDYLGSSNPSIASRYFAGKFVDLDRAQRLTIYVTNKVEQTDKNLQSTVDDLCPDLFPRGLATVVELPE